MLTYICMYMFVYIYIYVFIYVFIYMFICICSYMYIYMEVSKVSDRSGGPPEGSIFNSYYTQV